MKHTDIRELFAHADGYVDTTVTVCGWVRTARDSKNVAFLEINDGAVFQDRKKLEVKSVLDNTNDNNVWQGYSRFGAGFVDWRFVSVGNISTGTDLS